ncbi:Magnesium transport protein CorA [Aquicella siphonis]|uniref:Magnesium transport protein CorA n=1 Tax=Aquicella siphonis TaxID=254247 RepID=A0A5E4PGP5_9COXI|nr:magnesium/cobalt transporter CorA [Aquicella siphonis]VVC75652.1 Magnesium transport protein CorA [Aquicella siphonis]
MFSEVHKRAKKAGQPPGTPVYTGEKSREKPIITVTTYNASESEESKGDSLESCMGAQKPGYVTWVNVEGLHDSGLIDQIAKQFHLHPLTVEDILNVEQRPKVEEFDGYIFITLKVLTWQAKMAKFNIAQLSLVIGKDYILSFHEHDSSRFHDIRKRLQGSANQRLRQHGSDYLAYRMIDAVVDEYFVVLEAQGDQIEKIEQRVITSPKPQTARTLYRLKRQMLLLRKVIWPMREAVSHLLYVEDELITSFTRVYLRDVYDHAMQAIDTLETFRDMLSSILDMYLSALTIRMNEIMKTLTIITTIFIPITALASIYGMNVPGVPLMHSPWAFMVILSLMIFMIMFMIVFFRKKRWI